MGYLVGQRNPYLVADDQGIPKRIQIRKKFVKNPNRVSRLAVAICLFIRISVINLINPLGLSPLTAVWPGGNHGQNVPEAVPPSGLARQWHKALQTT